VTFHVTDRSSEEVCQVSTARKTSKAWDDMHSTSGADLFAIDLQLRMPIFSARLRLYMNDGIGAGKSCEIFLDHSTEKRAYETRWYRKRRRRTVRLGRTDDGPFTNCNANRSATRVLHSDIKIRNRPSRKCLSYAFYECN